MMRVFRKDVSDEELKAVMAPHLARLARDVVRRVSEPPKKASKKMAENQEAVTGEEKSLLQDILENPNMNVTARMSRLGLSAYKMNSLKGAVIKKGLVEQFPVNLGKAFGGKVMLLALTKAGFKALKKRAVVRPDNVSAEHWWWQKAQKGYYDRRSYEAVLEMRIGNSKSRADLGIKTKYGWVAIEVELGPGNAVANIENDLAAGFIRVVCCCKDRLVAKEVLRRLQAHRRYEKIKDKVEVKVLTELELVKELFGKNS